MDNKIKFKTKHIREYLNNGYTNEEMAIKYNLSLNQLRSQLARFKPTIIYDENELYREFEEYIKRNYYMDLFRDLEIAESVRLKLIRGQPVFANNLIKLLKFFDVSYEIKVEVLEENNHSPNYPRYIIKLPKFSKRSTEPRKIRPAGTKTVSEDADALQKARKREITELHSLIGLRRNTLVEALKRKGMGIATINEIVGIVDELCVEVIEFSIKCEKYGGGNVLLDNIAKHRVSQY